MTDTEIFEFVDKIRTLRDTTSSETHQTQLLQRKVKCLQEALSFSMQVIEGADIGSSKKDTTRKMIFSILEKAEEHTDG